MSVNLPSVAAFVLGQAVKCCWWVVSEVERRVCMRVGWGVDWADAARVHQHMLVMLSSQQKP
jgi:hypothetical protein